MKKPVILTAANGCPGEVLLTCVSGCEGDPRAVAPSASLQETLLPGAKFEWTFDGAIGTVSVGSSGKWSDCGGDGPFDGCSSSQSGGSAPLLVLIGLAIGFWMRRRHA